MRYGFHAKRKQPQRFSGPFLDPESQGQNLASTVLYVPYSLFSGYGLGNTLFALRLTVQGFGVSIFCSRSQLQRKTRSTFWERGEGLVDEVRLPEPEPSPLPPTIRALELGGVYRCLDPLMCWAKAHFASTVDRFVPHTSSCHTGNRGRVSELVWRALAKSSSPSSLFLGGRYRAKRERHSTPTPDRSNMVHTCRLKMVHIRRLPRHVAPLLSS